MAMTERSLTTLQPPPGSPATAWAARIGACWQASVKAILEVGRLIAAAKTDLPHGAFEGMIKSDLPFGASTAQRLMAIAADERITNPAHAQLLPPIWTTLYELTKLTDEQFEKGVETGKINPELERKAAIGAARAIAPGRIEPSDSLDYFPTPPWATRALIERVFPQIGARADCRRQQAWEPACGEGHIAGVLEEYFGAVIATDIHDYSADGRMPPSWWRTVDFLNPQDAHGLTPAVDWIITNPPFHDKTERFVKRALELAGVGVAMFVRMQWLETQGRYERIFRDRPPTIIAFFAERVPLCKGEWNPKGDTATAYVWLAWLKGGRGTPRAPYWIAPDCRDKLSHVDDVARFTARPCVSFVPEPATRSLTPIIESYRSEPEAQRDDTALTSAPASMESDSDEGDGIPDFLRRQPQAAE